MASRRGTTPLFEVLQGREPRRPEGRQEARVPAADPAPEPTRAGGSPRAEAGDPPIRIVGGLVQMPLVYAAVALALAIALVLGAWTLGFQRGRAEAESRQQLLESALGSAARVTEPEPSGGGAGSAPATDPVRSPPARATPENTPVPAIGAAAFLTGSGPTEADPRQDRHNYLQLGSQIRAAEAQAAIDLLGSRGLDAFAVVDPRSRRRNDGPLYVLFAARGFPSGEADSQEARRYREQVLAAGQAWKQAGGVKNFDDALWVLHRSR